MKKGTIFIFTSGEYSDYGIAGSFQAKTNFDLDVELAAYLEANPKQKSGYSFENQQFMQYLVDNLKIEETPIPEVHLGDYGNLPEKLEPST